MNEGPNLNGETLAQLFHANENGSQIDWLRDARLLDADGLMSLLDLAMQHARDDPSSARRLAVICAGAAEAANAIQIRPRATYTLAQTHAINGEFTRALELIGTARSQYDALGDLLSAVRTNLGKMHVLNELGRHQEALETGEETLRIAAEQDASNPQAGLIMALAHMNLGVCFETLGRYTDSLQAYALAEESFTALGMEDRLGDIRNNRGIVLVHLGRIGEALEAFEGALRTWEAEGLTLLQAQTLSNIGEAHVALGDFTRGLNAYEAARERFESLDAAAEHSILLRKTADAYLALNLHPEAVSTYRRALELLDQAGMADQSGRALWGLGAALTAQGDLEEAGGLLERAAGLFRSAGNIPMLATVTLELAALIANRGDPERARTAAVQAALQALELVDPEKHPVETLYANLRLSDLQHADPDRSEAYLSAAERASRTLNLPVIRYRVNSRLGHLRRRQGRDAEGEALLRSALADIENLRGRLAHEAVRTSFLADKTGVYDELIGIRLAAGDPRSAWEALELSERAKSRTLADLISGAVAGRSESAGDEGPVDRIRALQSELGAVYSRYFAPEPGSPQSASDLGRRVAELEEEIGRLRLQAAGRSRSISFESVPDAGELRRDLAGAGLLLVFHIVKDEVLAFLVDGDWIGLVRGFAPPAVITKLLQRLSAQWERVSVGGEFVRRNLPALQRSTDRVLEELYAACLAPVIDSLPVTGGDQVQRVTIVPHGPLHQVPFHALFDGNRYMADRFEIAYAPSATVFALCERKSRPPLQHALIAGLADGLIPLAEQEAETVSRLLAGAGVSAELLTGREVTADRVRSATGSADLIHLACHGLFRSDNPLFSALMLADGWLTGADVMDYELEGALVVLSACESGKGAVLHGEELIGLPRAFLGAGAAAVLVSSWLVNDEAAAELMSHWYRAIAEGAGRAAALNEAQRALRATHPHPYYWAPFLLIGQR